MNNTFEQLVEMKYRYWTNGHGDYMEIDDKISEYIREQFGSLYDNFIKNVGLGASIGLGWIHIYLEAAKKMQAMLDANPTLKLEIRQVKQKLGQLRIYYHLEPSEVYEITEELDEIIGEAIQKTSITCETCGEPGSMVSSGRIHVACQRHAV